MSPMAELIEAIEAAVFGGHLGLAVLPPELLSVLHLASDAILDALGIRAGAPHTIPTALHAAPPNPAIPITVGGVRQWPASPTNYSTASHGRPHDTWVVHAMEARRAASAANWFADPAAQCSAHLLVDTDGALYQSVPDACIAWHAGNQNVNVRGIGVEHAGFTGQPFLQAQYEASAAELVAHAKSWGLTPLRPDLHPLPPNYTVPLGELWVIDHFQVPGPGGKGGGAGQHTDCGAGWDWERFLGLVAEGMR